MSAGAEQSASLPGGDVLTVRGLSVTVRDIKLVQDIDLTIKAGERVGLIGESGSGKSLTALSIMGLLPEDLIPEGSVRLIGVPHDLVGADEKAMSKVRGLRLAMVFQEPMTALNPTMRVGDQVAEVMLIHNTRPSKSAVRADTVELFDQVGLPNPAEIVRAYPHQLSGGQRQRVVVALALANDPALLVCDEPTTALDVTVQALVLDLIVRGVVAREAAMMFITHDLAVVATVCQRVLVMYGGRVVETGTVQEVFTTPRHRYTEGLIAASDLDMLDDEGRLITIPGSVPAAGRFPAGCVFRSRCPAATEVCATQPEWTEVDGRGYACHHPANVSSSREGV